MKLVRRFYAKGRWFLVVREDLGNKIQYRGYVTITKQELEKLHVGPSIDFLGEAKEADLAGIFDPDQLVAGIDTADPGEQGMAVITAITRLEFIAGVLDGYIKKQQN